MGGTGERSGPVYGGIRSIINIFVSQMVKGTYLWWPRPTGRIKRRWSMGASKASNDTKEAAGRCDLVETDIVVWRTV